MSDLVIILNKQVESLERKLAEKFEEVARLKATIHAMDAAIVRLQAEANRNMEELCQVRGQVQGLVGVLQEIARETDMTAAPTHIAKIAQEELDKWKNR